MEVPDPLHRTLRHYSSALRYQNRVQKSRNFQIPIEKKLLGRFKKYFGDLILTH
jgi:hypothetical protein